MGVCRDVEEEWPPPRQQRGVVVAPQEPHCYKEPLHLQRARRRRATPRTFSAMDAELPLSVYFVVRPLLLRPPPARPPLPAHPPTQSIVALSLERLFYGVVWHRPKAVSKLAKKFSHEQLEPEFILSAVSAFKLVQVAVFASWYYLHFGMELPPVRPTFPTVLASICTFAIGQVLNLSVWYQIGKDGVCYGIKYGRSVPWCTSFPYNVMAHPQYTGAILTVWGMFGLLSQSAPSDWFSIPIIETVLYVLSMKVLEADVALPPGPTKQLVDFLSRKLKVA